MIIVSMCIAIHACASIVKLIFCTVLPFVTAQELATDIPSIGSDIMNKSKKSHHHNNYCCYYHVHI